MQVAFGLFVELLVVNFHVDLINGGRGKRIKQALTIRNQLAALETGGVFFMNLQQSIMQWRQSKKDTSQKFLLFYQLSRNCGDGSRQSHPML